MCKVRDKHKIFYRKEWDSKPYVPVSIPRVGGKYNKFYNKDNQEKKKDQRRTITMTSRRKH